MAVTIVGHRRVEPAGLPFVQDADDVVGIEWTAEVQEYSTAGSGFRFRQDIFDPRPRQNNNSTIWWHAVQNVANAAPNDAFGVFPSLTGVGLYWATWYENATPVEWRHIDGVELFAVSTVYPFWGRGFNDIDGTGITGKIFHTRNGLIVPTTLRGRILKHRNITNPAGNLSRNAITGAWVPLVGNYTAWDEFGDVDGYMRHVGRRYLREDLARALSFLPVRLFSEWQVDDAAITLSGTPVRVRYKDMRVLRGGRWYELLHWKTRPSPFGAGNYTGTDFGWDKEDRDYVVSACGHVEDTSKVRVDDHHFLLGLDKEATSPRDALTSIGTTTITYSVAMVTGPTWQLGGITIQEDKDRGFYVVQPGVGRGAALYFTARRNVLYFFSGDFARSDPSFGVGGGVNVSVYRGNDTRPLWQRTIGPNHVVDQEAPFAGTSNQNFNDLAVQLKIGEQARFVVDSPGGVSATATAFQLLVSSVEPQTENTGKSGLRAPAGTDRAVECPRCARTVLESQLIRDGVQKGLLVCPECYDPPTPPGNFRWPFRS